MQRLSGPWSSVRSLPIYSQDQASKQDYFRNLEARGSWGQLTDKCMSSCKLSHAKVTSHGIEFSRRTIGTDRLSIQNHRLHTDSRLSCLIAGGASDANFGKWQAVSCRSSEPADLWPSSRLHPAQIGLYHEALQSGRALPRVNYDPSGGPAEGGGRVLA